MGGITETPAADGGVRDLLGCTVQELDEERRSASLRMRGALCAITAPTHARQLDDLLERGVRDVRIDLDGLLLCTSHGLDLWDDIQHRLDAVDGHLILRGATGVVRRVLEVMATPDVHFCPTVEPAA